MKPRKSHKPVFDKYGGHYHLRISTVEHLKHLLALADGLWMATSCPLFGLNVDPAFLKFLDADGNSRIISDEVRNAIRWLLKCLLPSETLLVRSPSIPLNLVNMDDPEGKALGDAARLVLKNLNLPDATEISLEQVRNRQKIMAQADYNGDGVIPPEVVKDPDVMYFTRDLIATLGGVPDASGLKGVNEALLDQFRKEAEIYLRWQTQGIIPEDKTETVIMPFGTETPGMFQAITVIRDKIDQFFAQCALVRFDSQMAERISSHGNELASLDYKDRQAILEHLRLAPLATPNAEGILPLSESINEVYSDPVNVLRKRVIRPMFGEGAELLTEAQWYQVLERFALYEAWLKAKPSVSIESLGVDKIRTYLNAPYDAVIRKLIAEDKAVADELQQLQNLEKLLLYHQWLFEFVNNYASFPCLFNTEGRAIFETGTLVIGGREFTFSVKVENRAVHSNLAKDSGICLLYLQVTGPGPDDRFEIAVPVTRGNAREFYVGKRGIFFTVSGRELDAQIVQILENPISLWESVKEPFRRVYAVIGARLAQITTTIQKESEKVIVETLGDQRSIQAGLSQVQQRQASAPAQPSPSSVPSQPVLETPRAAGNLRDLMIGAGFLVAGMGTALKFLADTAKQLTNPQTLRVLLIMIGIFILVTVLTTSLSALGRLRRRDLGILLQASGWAINGQMRLIRPMARFFCRRTRIPKDASRHRKELLAPLEKLARRKQISRG